MDHLLRHCFRLEREAFLLDLRPKYILPSLINDDAITLDEQQEILCKQSHKHQVNQLVEILSKKGPKAFGHFVKSLQNEDAYPWLADKLLERKSIYLQKTVSNEVNQQLVAGGVPFQANYLLKREDKVVEIQDKLLTASTDKRRWVVIHGMVGSGKSVLAAEAVRDTYLYEKCFKSGICWVPIGHLKKENTILIKMHTLWEKLEPNLPYLALNNDVLYTTSETIKKINRVLKIAITHERRSNLLVILDDVWQPDVIEAFDIGCPIIVTTRDKRVVDSVSSSCSYVSLDDGLTLDESRKFLSMCVNVEPESLPPDVDRIHTKCKGLPITLTLIGAMMSPHGNKLEGWQFYREKIEKGISEIGRKRHASAGAASLKDTIRLSIESLDVELQKYYRDFAIFEDDVNIPSKVLEVLWHCTKFEVEDIMLELFQKSLIRMAGDAETGGKIYSIHDLYLEFLKEECNDLESRHKKIVENYLNLCKTSDGNFNYGLLPNDGYIYYYIGYHLDNANEVHLFPKMFLDLNFIQNKLQFAEPNDLLYDYKSYESYFVEVLKELEDCDAFIRKNAHLICRDDADIIQLALFEPSDSTVYTKAKMIAPTKTEKTYLEWSNQADAPYSSLLNSNLSFGELKCAVFSPDNKLVASVGDCTKVMIWDSASGRELENFKGHSDSINCCTFNSKGTVLATASSDGTVKLWQINLDHLVFSTRRSSKTKRYSFPKISDTVFDSKDDSKFTFDKHKEEVLWCSFSADDDLIISSDCVGVGIIWECKTGDLKWKRIIDQYPINCCGFCHKKKNTFATASDCNIKIWNVESKRCLATLNHNDQLVRQFCFTKNDRHIISAAGSTMWKWDMKNYTSVTLCNNSQSSLLWCCCLSPDEKFLVFGTSKHSVIVWNISSMKCVANLNGHKGPVQSVTFSNDGTKLLSASEDGHVIIWDMSKCSATSMISLDNNLSVRLAEELVIVSSDPLNCIQVRTGDNGKLKYKSIPDDCDITYCSLSSDSSEVVYGTKNGSVKKVLLKSEELQQYFPHSGQITFLVHIQNTHKFITCSEDCTLRVWDTEGKYTVLKGHILSVVMCVPFGDMTKLLSCSDDGTLRVWDICSMESLMLLEGHGNQKVNSCDVSPDENIFLSASSDCTIKLWSAEHGQQLRTLTCKTCVRCCRFSPVPGVLVSGEDSGEVMIWDLNDTTSIGTMLGRHSQDSWVTDIQFSHDGAQFVSVADSVKLWDNKGRLAQTLILPGSFTCALWLCPNFKTFVLIHNSVLYILKTIL